MIIVGGDFNTVHIGKLNRLPPEQGPTSKKSKVLNNVVKELGLGLRSMEKQQPQREGFYFLF